MSEVASRAELARGLLGRTVLGRGHGAGVNVHVGINLDRCDLEAGGLEQETGRGSWCERGEAGSTELQLELARSMPTRRSVPMTPLPIPLSTKKARPRRQSRPELRASEAGDEARLTRSLHLQVPEVSGARQDELNEDRYLPQTRMYLGMLKRGARREGRRRAVKASRRLDASSHEVATIARLRRALRTVCRDRPGSE